MSGPDASALGKYRLIAELGHGGMADVYLALVSGPAGFTKLVVVKKIRSTLDDDPDFLRMFMDEARLAARLNHPNVIQTNEVGGEGRTLFIAMEYLEGQPLNRVVAQLGRKGGLTLAIHLRILIEAIAGLHYAHELLDFDGTKLCVVHRDMTPHNVFVSYNGQIKVVDFGIAKALGSSTETRAGVLKGKAAYMAPEQALGDPVDRRADIFSVGVMLWEAITGTRLFREDNDLAVLQKIVTGAIPRPSAVNPDVPGRLEAICMKALSNNREDRYATAAELQAELEEALEAMGERPQLRDFGKLLAAHFSGEEAQIKALVEAHMSALKAASDSEPKEPSIPQLENGPLKLPVLDGIQRDASPGAEPPAAIPPASPDPKTGATTPATRTSLVQVSPASAATQPRWGLWLAGLAATAGTAAALVFWPHAQSSAPPKEIASTAKAAIGGHTLHLESTPPGAMVSEGAAPLGATPLSLSLDPAQIGARQFILSLEGYAAHTIQQGPTHDDVRVVVQLMREVSEAKVSADAKGQAKPRSRGGPVHPVKSAPSAAASAPLPINTAR